MVTILKVDSKKKFISILKGVNVKFDDNINILEACDEESTLGYIIFNTDKNLIEIKDIVFTPESTYSFVLLDSLVKSVIGYAINRNMVLLSYKCDNTKLSRLLKTFEFKESENMMILNIALCSTGCNCTKAVRKE